jgi:hypothetical protein
MTPSYILLFIVFFCFGHWLGGRLLKRGNFRCMVGLHDPEMKMISTNAYVNLLGKNSPIVKGSSYVEVGLFCKRCHMPVKR